uniref:Uncharacterized protein n=1 Tax=Siphoviridae sp. ctYKh4 TaxID=2823586 RepID=A0A8S5LCM9_9CAUD|nr:MAG TPA: hypothetical protein [Siphoviridae sp. ctYKh4]
MFSGHLEPLKSLILQGFFTYQVKMFKMFKMW